MASQDAPHDDNRVVVLLAESSTVPWEFEPVQIDPTTWALLIENA